MQKVFGLPPVPGWGRWTYLTFPDSDLRAEMSAHLAYRAAFVRVRSCGS